MAGLDAVFSNLGVLGGLVKGLMDPDHMGAYLEQGLANGIQSAESAFGGGGGNADQLNQLAGSSFDSGGSSALMSLGGF